MQGSNRENAREAAQASTASAQYALTGARINLRLMQEVHAVAQFALGGANVYIGTVIEPEWASYGLYLLGAFCAFQAARNAWRATKIKV